MTPTTFIYPNALAKMGVVPGGPKRNISPPQTKGAPKWQMPYGSHASTLSAVFLCAERMLLKFAPYSMFSRDGKTRTHIGGRYSADMNLHEKKSIRYTAIGKKGRKNCLVIGIIKLVMYKATKRVLVKGPGLCITHKLKMLTIARNRY